MPSNYTIPPGMSFTDRQQLREYGKQIEKLSSVEHCREKALQYVREDAEIQDINHHLNTLVIQ